MKVEQLNEGCLLRVEFSANLQGLLHNVSHDSQCGMGGNEGGWQMRCYNKGTGTLQAAPVRKALC